MFRDKSEIGVINIVLHDILHTQKPYTFLRIVCSKRSSPACEFSRHITNPQPAARECFNLRNILSKCLLKILAIKALRWVVTPQFA